uniref:Uncharacterized protein n=1 Tax=Timema monikensis TaxID=170555 RepID=A0A7R9HUI3_9NEOP|nr:unnamed protein product [Timema monikensis]
MSHEDKTFLLKTCSSLSNDVGCICTWAPSEPCELRWKSHSRRLLLNTAQHQLEIFQGPFYCSTQGRGLQPQPHSFNALALSLACLPPELRNLHEMRQSYEVQLLVNKPLARTHSPTTPIRDNKELTILSRLSIAAWQPALWIELLWS